MNPISADGIGRSRRRQPWRRKSPDIRGRSPSYSTKRTANSQEVNERKEPGDYFARLLFGKRIAIRDDGESWGRRVGILPFCSRFRFGQSNLRFLNIFAKRLLDSFANDR